MNVLIFTVFKSRFLKVLLLMKIKWIIEKSFISDFTEENIKYLQPFWVS